MTRPATFDHLRKTNGKRRTVAVCLDEDALQALTDAEAALADVPEGESTQQRRALIKARDAAKAAVDEATVEMLFASIGRKAWEALIDAHPPTEEQIAKAAERGEEPPDYDVEEFALAAVVAACVEPVMTLDEVRELYDTWNAPEFGQLYSAALIVNSQSRIVPFRSGSAETRT